MELHDLFENVRHAVGGLCPILSTLNWRRRKSDNDAEIKGPGPIMSMLFSLLAAGVIGVVSGTIVATISVAQIATKLESESKRLDDEHARVGTIEQRLNNHMDAQRRNGRD